MEISKLFNDSRIIKYNLSVSIFSKGLCKITWRKCLHYKNELNDNNF